MQDTNAGQIVLLGCNKIIRSDNSKHDLEFIARLGKNIKKNGILQPLTVRPVNYGMYEIIDGNKRFQSARLCGFTSVPCIIMNIDERLSFAVKLMEKSFKSNFSVFEKAEFIKLMIIDYKYSISEICNLISLDIYEMLEFLKILNFSHENRIKIENACLSEFQCRVLTRLDNTDFFDIALSEIIDNHMNDFQTEEYISKIIKNKRNRVIFKDLRIFTNTIQNAVDKMKLSGVKVISDKNESDSEIRYEIVISKN